MSNFFSNMNLANQLTVLRICLIPIFVLVASVSQSLAGDIVAAFIFALTAFTDFLDGHIARTRNMVTTFGKFLDPLADKLLTMSAFVMLVAMDRAAAWIVILILAREFAVTGLRILAANEGIVIAASAGGKVKTTLQMLSIIILLIFTHGAMFVIGQILLVAALFATLHSGWEYFKAGKDLLTNGGM